MAPSPSFESTWYLSAIRRPIIALPRAGPRSDTITMIRRAIGVVMLGVLALCASPAAAQAPDPWAEGVTEAQKHEAQRLLEEGNAAFLEKRWGDALELYEQAVAQWDHPAIRFNMVRCLIQLERHVEAYDSVVLALAYGAAPLEEAVYNEALAYEKLLLGQIAEIEVSCEQADTEVTLDGQPLLRCPGRERRRLTPGSHQVVGTKSGFLTQTQNVVLIPGKDEAVVVKLEPIGANAVITRRWATWKPWAVVGGGLVVGGLGALVQLVAVANMDAYNEQIGLQCGGGCTEDEIPASTADLEDTALLQNKIAIGLMAAGAATVVTGGILVFMNRGRTTYPDETATQVSVTPLMGGGATVSVRARF
jgi:hypothetical protein